MELLTNFIMVIILQNISTSNQHTVPLKIHNVLSQFYHKKSNKEEPQVILNAGNQFPRGQNMNTAGARSWQFPY